jgi:tetratricopeptide (TPR) repeat protein
MLEAALREGKLERDAKVAKTIGLAWFVAREHERAKEALSDAATLAEDGQLYVRLAQLNIERESWAEAAAAGRKALRKGGLDSPGKVHLLVGIAEARRGRKAAARKAFRAAAKSPKTRRSAEGWMKFLSSSETPVTAAGSGTSPE